MRRRHAIYRVRRASVTLNSERSRPLAPTLASKIRKLRDVFLKNVTPISGRAEGRYGRFWPNFAVADIRPERQLSGDKLPPPSQRAVCRTTIFPPTRIGTHTAHRPSALVTCIALVVLSGGPPRVA